MRKLIATLAFASLCATANAAVIIDTTTVADYTTTGVTTGYSSFTITLGGGLNKGIFVACYLGASSPPAISSVTVNGFGAQFVQRTYNAIDSVELYRSTNAITGVNSIQVWLPGVFRNDHYLCGAWGFENVDQTSPINISSGVVNGSSVTFTTTLGTTTLISFAGEGTTPSVPVPGTGETLAFGTTNYARFTGMAGSYKDGGTQQGSKSMSWTIESNNIMIGAAINTAAGAPDLTSLSPATKGIGTGEFTLTVNGANFVSGATVTWNGSNRTTSFVSSTQLTATILAGDVTNIGQFPVRVINPDTSRSNPVNFSLTGDITKVWAGDGGYKPTQEDLYGTDCSTCVTGTRIWDGNTIKPFQARNEVNGIALVLENNTIVNSTMVTVSYPVLTHSSGYVISSTPTSKSNLWDWRNRPIQMYYVRYLPIQGLGRQVYESYDETHVPERLQATHTIDPTTGQGIISGGWSSRPDHDKHYPDILIPFEAMNVSTFTVASSSSQVIWIDIYVPKTAPPGLYTGSVSIYEGPQLSTTIPISLTVYPFTMPDVPPSKPYAYLSVPHINWRMGGVAYPNYGGLTSTNTITRTHFYQELWRHGVTPVGDAMQGGCGTDLYQVGPCPEFQIQLDGTLFDPTSGYANAPGVRTPVPVYSMYTYGNWRGTSWWPYTAEATCTNANIWVNWFQSHSPNTEYWWYMEDEPSDITTTSGVWSEWVRNCAAPGNALKPFLTIRCDHIDDEYPGIKHCATTEHYNIATVQEQVRKEFGTSNDKRYTFYNGWRPGAGTFATEDDGIAPRVNGWIQFKKKFDHWFYWETTNYTHGAAVNTDLFNDALTFGYYTSDSGTFGRTGFLYSNGDGVLLYPGTDALYPADSYGVDVPFPSWRLKMWRRGINDHTYLTLASQFDGKAVDRLVQQIIPRVLWERGVYDTADPTYQYGGISWSRDPNVWEQARETLANIISEHR